MRQRQTGKKSGLKRSEADLFASTAKFTPLLFQAAIEAFRNLS